MAATADTHRFRNLTLRLARIHFYLIGIYTLAIIAFDGWKLVTPNVTLERWTLAVGMLIITTLIWFISRPQAAAAFYHKALIFGLILMDIALATYTIYSERGMASRGVMLFSLPIVVALALNSRRALLATASLCTAAYSLAAIRYFTLYPSEGYKVELYGVVGFYSAMFFVLAELLWLINSQK